MNEFLNDRIITATRQLFLTTFKTDITVGEPYLLETDSDNNWDVSGVISITGSYSGIVAIRFKKAIPEAMLKSSGLKNMSLDLHSRLINDMIGELTNVITGNTFSDEAINDIMLSVPVTIQGRNHVLSWSREPEITVIPFSIKNEIFVVQTELKKIF